MPENTNEQLVLMRKGCAPTVREAPVPVPAAGEIVVRARAVAINPVDGMLPALGDIILPWLTYPAVPGTDVAGEVVAVGAGVTRFAPGDRVVGHAAGLEKSRNRASEGGFQRFPVLLEHMAAPIPEAMEFATAAVLPLGLSTAACALFEPAMMGLRAPNGPAVAPTGETVLVWGAGTGVGMNAVQLARAAGYAVVATASARSAQAVRALGAARVLDREAAGVLRELRAVLRGETVAGAVAIGTGSARPCLAALRACRGKRFVARVSAPVSFTGAPCGWRRWPWLAPRLAWMGIEGASRAVAARRAGIASRFVWGGTLVDDELGPAIWARYLPDALRAGRHVAAPPPIVVGEGIAAIPAAIARLGEPAVAGRKLVVVL